MLEKSFINKHASGLHARPAALLVQKANSFPCEISLTRGDKRVSARSLLSIISLGIGANESVTVIAAGEKEAEAIQAIGELLEAGE
ncbi:HPr family phosphocarrier protein [Desulfosporosinus sp. PR]|uniref:HPr family phosphocarrier protein n=1 Tax=Candidatus Desulfosporosinus nitrosoreducens TaxID=3401928 RepID=UPI0027FC3F27|nr:HPr family phosphocarrier protein [Desulfosporosinus sp. PR]MDQ7096608.1 HPr family phosphocarrier protein [Desulfosporosinus sp. PR]